MLAAMGLVLVAAATGIAAADHLGASCEPVERCRTPAIPVLLLGSILLIYGVWTVDVEVLSFIVKIVLTWATINAVFLVLQFLRHSRQAVHLERFNRESGDYEVVA